jgi:hypothetical protein
MSVCRDTQTDLSNCGSCGTVCNPGEVCSRGACVVSCGAGLNNCSGVCRDLQTDRANCGACGTVCPAGQVCSAGACRVSCGAGTSDCAGACRDLQTDVANCGACGTVCAAGRVCSRGACVVSCGAGTTDCAGVCRDTQTDLANCGACGNACATGEVCSRGLCVVSCGAGLNNCTGVCRDLQTDNANCGTCGRVCPSGQVCSAGACQVSCGAGSTTAPACAATSRPTTPTAAPAVFSDGTTFGTVSGRTSDDYKSPAYSAVTGRSLLVQTDEYYFGFTNLAPSALSFAAYVASNITTNCSTTWLRSGVDFASTNLTTDQRAVLGFALRGHDINGGSATGGGGCAMRGSNENSYVNFLSGPSWWVFGTGNCIACASGWTSYDNGMLNRASISSAACTAGSWPCNANGRWWSSSVYPSNQDTKTRYVQFLVR